LDKIDETRMVIAKTAIGKLRGLAFRIIFLAKRTFTPQRIIKISVAPIIKSCFGIMKKSVVLRRKNKGRKNKVREIINVEIVSM